MKRFAFTTAYLTVISTLVFGQLSSSFVPNKKESTVKNSRNQSFNQVSLSYNEFAPLNNLPFFPGGPDALLAYFDNPDLYPYPAQISEKHGTVRVRFWVQPNGELTNIQVVESQGVLLDTAAIRAIAQMPRWYPAHQNGRPIACPARLSVKFQFNETYSPANATTIP